MSDLKDQRIQSFMRLAISEALQGGKFKDFISELIPSTCKALSAHKVSFWLYRSENDEFESIQCYDAETKKSTSGEALDKTTYPTFIRALKKHQFIRVESNNDLPEMEELVMDYLLKNKLSSWACMQVWSDNRLFGIVAVEWKAKKDFTIRIS